MGCSVSKPQATVVSSEPMSKIASPKAEKLASSPLRALYVHHVGVLGGSSRSLFELLRGFPDGAIVPHYVGPKGKFVEMLCGLGIPVETCMGISQFDNCDYSYYRGLRWIILLRELFLLMPTYLALKRARDRWGGFDVVHINDITMPFVAWLTKHLFPESVIVVHARAVQRTANTGRKHWLQEFYRKNADAIIAINANVSESLPADLPVHVIHNGMEVPSDADVAGRKADKPFSVGMIGVLVRSKGCVDFVKAAAICRDQGYNIRFMMFGAGSRLRNIWRDYALILLGINENVTNEIRKLIIQFSLEDVVILRPSTIDLNCIYEEIDIVCFPSYLDAPGRPIFEAGFYGIPSIAAISRPKPDTFLPGETGVIVKPGCPKDLAKAIMHLHDCPEERNQMGKAARLMANERFDVSKTARSMVILYRSLMVNKNLL